MKKGRKKEREKERKEGRNIIQTHGKRRYIVFLRI